MSRRPRRVRPVPPHACRWHRAVPAWPRHAARSPVFSYSVPAIAPPCRPHQRGPSAAAPAFRSIPPAAYRGFSASATKPPGWRTPCHGRMPMRRIHARQRFCAPCCCVRDFWTIWPSTGANPRWSPHSDPRNPVSATPPSIPRHRCGTPYGCLRSTLGWLSDRRRIRPTHHRNTCKPPSASSEMNRHHADTV